MLLWAAGSTLQGLSPGVVSKAVWGSRKVPEGLDFTGHVVTTRVSGKPGNAALRAERPLAQRWGLC